MAKFITLSTELTAKGVEVTEPTIGKVATIKRKDVDQETRRWEVYPYAFPPSERLAEFKSYEAAEYYALALAYEMVETGTTRKA